MEIVEYHLLGAPALDNPGKDDLLWIICDEWPKSIDCPPVMPVRTSYYLWSCHGIPKRREDSGNRSVVQLLSKCSKFSCVVLLPAC